MEDVSAATSLVSDGDLANAVRTGDIAAFTVLADRRHPSFHSFRPVWIGTAPDFLPRTSMRADSFAWHSVRGHGEKP